MNTHDPDPNGEYHDASIHVRCLMVASAPSTLKASLHQVPSFYPAEPPTGRISLFWGQFLAEIASAMMLAFFVSTSGAVAMGLLLPAILVATEFIIIPLVKYSPLLDKRVMAMRAFLSEDRYNKDAFTQALVRRKWQDLLVLLIVLFCFFLKSMMLVNYGTFQPQAMLIFNWIVALCGIGAHLSGLPSQVLYYYCARWVDASDRSRRLHKETEEAIRTGRTISGELATHEFRFTSAVPLRVGEVDSHRLVLLEDGSYVIYAKGLFNDAHRTAWLVRQKTAAAQAELARALVRLQLETLNIADIKVFQEAPEPPPTIDGLNTEIA